MGRLGAERGGVFADGNYFRYQGGQVHSVLSLTHRLASRVPFPRRAARMFPGTLGCASTRRVH